jgi:hypothetical protein
MQRHRRLTGAVLAATLLWLGQTSRAAAPSTAEAYATPSFRRPDLLQFRVKADAVLGISVLVDTVAKDGRIDRQIIALDLSSNRGEFPEAPGYVMWETDKIRAARDQWHGNRGNLDHVAFSYVVHTASGSERAAVESQQVYRFGSGDELWRGFASSSFAIAGRNPGRGLMPLARTDVQRAVDALAARPPRGKFTVLPGAYPHPLHPENQLVAALRALAAQKRAHPQRRLFARVAIYNHDSMPLTEALRDARRAGVDVEMLTDWSQVTPYLSDKPTHEGLRAERIPVYNVVRNGPGGDIRTNHAKFWIFGERDAQGRITSGTVFDAAFNTEFGHYPKNQEAMIAFRDNRDVATVYNHIFEAMKGNAPLDLVVDPERARFVVTHPLYPYRTPGGQRFGSWEALLGFLGKARRELTMLDYVQADGEIARATAEVAGRGARVDQFLNGWKVQHDGWGNVSTLRGQGANVHLIYHGEGGSPVHHKSAEADGKWVRHGSLNPGWWSFQSDETLLVMRSRRVARQVLGAANRLAYGYPNWTHGARPPRRMADVDVEVRVRDLARDQVAEVQFAGAGSPELEGKPVALSPIAQSGGHARVFRGSARLPLGFVHQGRPVVRLRDGTTLASTRETFFTVDPPLAGRQRLRVGFRKPPATPAPVPGASAGAR